MEISETQASQWLGQIKGENISFFLISDTLCSYTGIHINEKKNHALLHYSAWNQSKTDDVLLERGRSCP
jgi:hypothetical protein